MERRLEELENEEITILYNRAYGDPEEGARISELTEEMFAASAIHDEKDKW